MFGLTGPSAPVSRGTGMTVGPQRHDLRWDRLAAAVRELRGDTDPDVLLTDVAESPGWPHAPARRRAPATGQ